MNYVGFVVIDQHRGVSCHFVEAETEEVRGGIIAVHEPKYGSRPLEKFERVFDTREEAYQWAAGKMQAFGEKCLAEAARIRAALACGEEVEV